MKYRYYLKNTSCGFVDKSIFELRCKVATLYFKLPLSIPHQYKQYRYERYSAYYWVSSHQKKTAIIKFAEKSIKMAPFNPILNLLSLNRYTTSCKMLSNTARRTAWQENRPDALEDICIRYILRHPSILFYAIDVSQKETSIHEHETQLPETSKYRI